MKEKQKTSGPYLQYATGRRKTAVAKVWIKNGSGKVMINNLNISDYFTRLTHRYRASEPLIKLNCMDKFDVICQTLGGGKSGQADAVRHGISRALDYYNPDYHTVLASNNLLTRDDRMVESKKYGKHKARRSTQFAK
uniref:30S ribosomal protein S9 n=1 Tax=Biomphalaria glabrata TaxID=6526 RepID=A0A2C9M1S7_BIOGL